MDDLTADVESAFEQDDDPAMGQVIRNQLWILDEFGRLEI